MTAQIGDIYKYRDKRYSIVDIQMDRGFCPEDFGLKAHGATTACYRGFWCVFEIKDGRLTLDELYIHNKDGRYPKLNGVEVSPAEYQEATVFKVNKDEPTVKMIPKYMGHRVYRGVNLHCPYNGTVVLGFDFDSKYYIHMGRQPYWAYKELVALCFEDGMLTEELDCSEYAAEKRREMEEP